MNYKYFAYFAEIIFALFLAWLGVAIFREIPNVDADDVVFYIFGCILAGFSSLCFLCDAIEDIIDDFKK